MLATTLRARLAARLLLRALEDRTVPAVFAVTNVADFGEGSLRDALSRVVDGREDRIVFDESLAGQTVVLPEARGYSIRAGVTIVGPNALPITLMGNTRRTDVQGTVLDIETTGKVNLRNLRITGGFNAIEGGGGIRNIRSELTLDRCEVVGNTGTFGGGIAALGGRLTVNDSVIRGNTAGLFDAEGGGDGGGIAALSASVTLNNTVVESNTATGARRVTRGGGIFTDSVLVVNGGSIVSNRVLSNGGFFFPATAQGGGIYSGGLLSLDGVTATGNNAMATSEVSPVAQGGAIFSEGGPFNLTRNWFDDNSTFTEREGFPPSSRAASEGGAVALATRVGSSAFLADNSFADNRSELFPSRGTFALDGGAVAVLGGSAVTLQNNRFTSNAVVGSLDAVTAFALLDDRLFPFSSVNPGVGPASLPITGLLPGDTLTDIDFRPQNGLLYGLARNAATGTVRLYTISTQTGAANPLNATGTFVDATGTPIANLGSDFGIDFNPTVDRLRVVSNTGLNFRIDPNTGAFADGNLGGAAAVAGLNPDGNVNFGGVVADISATAYTNNFPNSTVTSQYTISTATDTLNIQNPPNSGNQMVQFPITVGGVAVDITEVGGFDIPASVTTRVANGSSIGVSLAVLTIGGRKSLYALDLSTGEAQNLGSIGTFEKIEGLALQDTGAGLGIQSRSVGLSADGTSLVRARIDGTGIAATVAILDAATGTVPIRLVGLDFRPETGQLFGLAVDPALDTATLYRVDPQTGRATAIGTPGGIAFVDAAGVAVDLPELSVGYEVDFNPAVDMLRVVTGSGLNFRVNPDTGAPSDGNLGGGAGTVAGINTDAKLNPFAGGTAATAYTNNFAPVAGVPAVTTQYTITVSGGVGTLSIQNPPNLGVLASPLILTLDGSTPLAVGAVLGFDIPATVVAPASGMPVASGTGFAILTVGGATSTYSIDLTTGRATAVAATTGTDLTLATGSGLATTTSAKGAGLSVANGALVYLTGNTFAGSEVRAGEAVLRLSDLSGTARSKGGNTFGGFRSADGTLIAEVGSDVIFSA